MWVAPIANGPYEKISSSVWKGYRQRQRSWEQTPIGGSHNSGSCLSGCNRCRMETCGNSRPGRPVQFLVIHVCVCVFGFTCHVSTQSLSEQCTRHGISSLFKTEDRHRPDRPLSLVFTSIRFLQNQDAYSLFISAFSPNARLRFFNSHRNKLVN